MSAAPQQTEPLAPARTWEELRLRFRQHAENFERSGARIAVAAARMEATALRFVQVWHAASAPSGRAAVKVGERVRIVQMDGCMAHVRGAVTQGLVEAIVVKAVYGSSQKRQWASIRLQDGSLDERCAEPSSWFRHDDGVMEYRH